MRTATFLIDSYVRDGEAFHFARKQLPTAPPRIVHTHDYYETFWIEDGEGTHWINGQKVELTPGQLVFVRPSDTHGFQSRGATPLRLVNVSFFARSAAHLLERYGAELDGRFFWAPDPLPRVHRLDEAQQSMLERLVRDLASGPRGLAQIEGFLLSLMTRVLGRPADIGDTAPAWLAGACRAAREPAVFRLGARGLVTVARRSHEHVCRAMRRHLDTSPSGYVNAIRMEHAARLLGGSDESISNIALDCGLENLSHFYRMFRGHYGMTPRAYRRRHQVDIVQPA